MVFYGLYLSHEYSRERQREDLAVSQNKGSMLDDHTGHANVSGSPIEVRRLNSASDFRRQLNLLVTHLNDGKIGTAIADKPAEMT